MENKLSNFTNKYQLSKTLRFRLEPVGGTEEFIKRNQFIEEDERRAVDFKKMKKILDKYHKSFIEDVLSKHVIDDDDLQLLYKSYNSADNNEKRKANIEKQQEKLRKSIAKSFTENKYKEVCKGDYIKKILETAAIEERPIVEMFKDFTTYFTGYNQNRENMYVDDAKSTAISFRLINQNLNKFMDNIKIYSKVAATLPEAVKQVYTDFEEYLNVNSLDELFAIDNYTNVLTQAQIEAYNAIIGGRTEKDKKKQVKGLNQYIQEYNSTHKDSRLPKLIQLFNQILSDKVGISERIEAFSSAKSVTDAIKQCYNEELMPTLEKLYEIMKSIRSYDMNGIFIKWGTDVTTVSQRVYGNYSAITERIKEKWTLDNPQGKKKQSSYEKERDKYVKSIASVSIGQISSLMGDNNVLEYFAKMGAIDDGNKQCENYFELIRNLYVPALEVMSKEDINTDYLQKNHEPIKAFLDAVKELQWFLRMLLGSGEELNKNEEFYGEFLPLYEKLDATITPLYNKVRNFVTKKAYSVEKFKVNFDCSSFLTGWSTKYEKSGGFIFIKDGQYYLGISTTLSKEDIAFLEDRESNNNAKRIIYNFQKPDEKNTPRLFIRSKGEGFAPAVGQYKLPIDNIIDIYDNRYFKTEFRKSNPQLFRESLTKMIDYFKVGFKEHDSYKIFNFNWKESSEYNDISEFYKDTINACYGLEFINIDWDKLMEFTNEGKFFVFRIANKDFSQYSKGRKNLHTIYWNMLFDKNNLKDVVYKLSGQAEIFFRRASIKQPIVHKANIDIANKCKYSQKQESKFDYDIIKDRRFTSDQYELHASIIMNFKQPDASNSFNEECLQFIKNGGIKHIIGIDRGERNLLYLVVVDLNGKIVLQKSLNSIASNPNIPDFKQDYHQLLSDKQGDRLQARRDWNKIENIKELKDGYMSQIVHEIYTLMLQYDAIVVLENLNRSFMQKRGGIEKSVYQKFEKMLIDKLGYIVDKTKLPEEPGGALHAVQLADTFARFNKFQNGLVRQCGFIFYIPAWCTSKIDPTTGFVSLVKFKYENMEQAKSLISKIDAIRYDEANDYFTFNINFDELKASSKGGKRNWLVCTYGDRIEYRKEEKKHVVIENLTSEFKSLFEQYKINIHDNLKEQICVNSDVKFFKRLMHLLGLTLQMRNSITDTDIDYLISPVINKANEFFDSRKGEASLPLDADANGAYNIARKGLMVMDQIKSEKKPEISNEVWLNFAQKNDR